MILKKQMSYRIYSVLSLEIIQEEYQVLVYNEFGIYFLMSLLGLEY